MKIALGSSIHTWLSIILHSEPLSSRRNGSECTAKNNSINRVQADIRTEAKPIIRHALRQPAAETVGATEALAPDSTAISGSRIETSLLILAWPSSPSAAPARAQIPIPYWSPAPGLHYVRAQRCADHSLQWADPAFQERRVWRHSAAQP